MTRPAQSYRPGLGLPVALPVASTADVSSPQVRSESGEFRETNTPVTSSPEQNHAGSAGPSPRGLPRRPRHHYDARALAELDTLMPTRDRQVLTRVAEHRFLTTKQIQAFVFTTHETEQSAARTTRHVVARLERLRLLRALERRIGGVRSGSSAAIWQLTTAAARMLRDDGAAYRTSDPSPRFLDHCLAIADVHLGLRQLADLDHVRAISVETEPAAWRRYTGQGGEARTLQPDLAAEIQTGSFTDRWFVEVDLGTESLPTLLKKCGYYETYRATGIEQDQYGAFPLVLWLFTKQERADKLRAAIARSPRLTQQLYRFAVPDSFLSTMRETLQ